MPEPTADEIAAKAVAELTEPKQEETPPEKGNGEDKPAPAPDPVEQAARAQGWKPREEFTGDPGLWVDAKEFVGRAPLFEKIKETGKTVKRLEKTVEAMAKHHAKSVEHEVNRRIAELKSQRSEAIKEGDVEKVEKIDTEIESQKAAKSDIPKPPDIAPEIKEWVDANDWYVKDAELHDFALAFNDTYLKRRPGDLEGSLKATAEATKRAFPEKFPKAQSKPDAEPAKQARSPVEGAAGPAAKGKGYTIGRLTSEQRLAHDQYIKAGTFDALAKEAKMTPTEFYVKQLDEIGELTK